MLLAFTMSLLPGAIRAEVTLKGRAQLTGGAATRAYLVPGPIQPEAIGIALAALELGWRRPRQSLRAGYDFLLQALPVGGQWGLFHRGRLVGRLKLKRSGTFDFGLRGGAIDFLTSGGIDSGATTDIVATRARYGGASLGAGLRRGRLRIWSRASLEYRVSQALLSTSGNTAFTEQLGEVLLEGRAGLEIDSGQRTILRLAVVGSGRFSEATYLSHAGGGLELGVSLSPRKGLRLLASARAQLNSFRWTEDTTLHRTDLFSRVRLRLQQELGKGLRLGLVWAHAANGSEVAAYDADRHLLLLSFEAEGVLLRW